MFEVLLCFKRWVSRDRSAMLFHKERINIYFVFDLEQLASTDLILFMVHFDLVGNVEKTKN